jgi:hypothetical protein
MDLGQEKYFSDWPIRRIISSEILLDYCAGIITNWLSACLVSHRNCKDAEAATPSTMMPAASYMLAHALMTQSKSSTLSIQASYTSRLAIAGVLD